jgi:hypothetical protein
MFGVEGEVLYANLKEYGFTEPFIQESASYDGLFPARVTRQHRELYRAVSENGELVAEITAAPPYMESDMRELAERTIQKPDSMTDDEN